MTAAPLRILYVVYHEYARLPIHASEVIEEMARQGHTVTVVTAVDPAFLRTLHWPSSVRVHQVPILTWRGCRMVSFAFNLLRVLPRWCRELQPDAIYERFALTTVATVRVARRARVPLVAEINGILQDELAMSRAGGWRLRLQTWVERQVFPRCAHLIAVTEGIRAWVHQQYGVPLERITALSNGTNAARFRPLDRRAARQTFGLEAERPVVGYLGSLFPWCGLEQLIDAAPAVLSKIPTALFLIGGGQAELKAGLEARARDRGIADHVRFVGEVSWDQAPPFINTFDVAVAPAHFADRRSGISPQKVYAYLACERPVVGTDLPGLGDVLTREQIGLAVPAGAVTPLADALIALLQDPTRARTMGQRGRAFILARHTWARVVEQTVEICRHLIPRSAACASS